MICLEKQKQISNKIIFILNNQYLLVIVIKYSNIIICFWCVGDK